ncbi:TPA: ATP-dependent Clp protease ATP-binding subunit [Enterococcus faecalis]|nr:ATP-dependent Clp protease ATP-binding subunit [Enterococcus faecalis]HAP3008581.1 ATP-dependent Clp protease ATP-binding subunit [Enterococcus faecalis]
MKIIVSNKPREKFDADLDEHNINYIRFEDLLVFGGSDSDEPKLVQLINIDEDSKVLVFTAEGASTLKSHIFEKIPDFIKTLRASQHFETFLINNPSKLLTKGLERISDVEFESTTYYDPLTEKNIKDVSINFDDKIIGQNKAKKSILRSLIRTLTRKDSSKPLVLMFYGRPGIGKTETAKYLAKQLYDGDIVREQMSMASNESSVSYFKSTSHHENSFSKTLMNRSSNIILLDEFALSHPVIHAAFFQLFDEGTYTDNNYTVDMRNSIIICTSNILRREDMYKQIDEALLSRFDAFISFEPFSTEEKEIIIAKVIEDYKKDIKKEFQEKINWQQSAKLLKATAPSLTNMRNIKNYVEEYFANELLKSILDTETQIEN